MSEKKEEKAKLKKDLEDFKTRLIAQIKKMKDEEEKISQQLQK